MGTRLPNPRKTCAGEVEVSIASAPHPPLFCALPIEANQEAIAYINDYE
jgi:hypothetical protein